MKKIVLILLVLFFFVLGACGSIFEKEPVGIGKDFSELKQSPCACLELKKAPVLPDWLT